MRDEFIDDVDEDEFDDDLGLQPTWVDCVLSVVLFCGVLFFAAAILAWLVQQLH